MLKLKMNMLVLASPIHFHDANKNDREHLHKLEEFGTLL